MNSTIMYRGLPAQMLPKSVKEQDKWKQHNLDRLEQIGKAQFMDNLSILENYEMLSGKFITHHYFENDDYQDMLSQLTQDFDLPNYLRHYDIISPFINTLSGEMQEHPDNFRVRRYDEGLGNAFIREKTRLLQKFVTENMQLEINKALVEAGYDPLGKNTPHFDDDTQKQQYVQAMEQKRKELTPPEIEAYMKMDWNDISEIWGQRQTDHDKDHFDFRHKDKKEFEDLLIGGRCWRHFYINGYGHQQETWNPLTTFWHKSPDIEFPEHGDYIGQVVYLTPSAVVNRWSDKLTAEEIKGFDADDTEFTKGKQNDMGEGFGTDPYGVAYGSIMPYSGYGPIKMATEQLGFNPLYGILPVEDGFWNSFQSGSYSLRTQGLIQCTIAYWKSKEKQGYYCFFDEELGMLRNMIVDENFIIPKGVKQYDNVLWEENKNKPNTLTWTWTDVVWQGIKVSRANTNLEKDLYLDVRRADLQIEGDEDPNVKVLPVIGCFSNARMTDPVSFVDMVKPDQIGHNVAINQLYQIMEREVGRFLIMDTNLLPKFKGWAGDKGYLKFIEVARSLGITIADTSPSNTKGANAGGQLPKMIDLDESARMLSRLRIAESFEMRAARRVGISDQRMGDIGKEETATGVQAATQKSYTQTRSYFTDFFHYKKRYLRMNLNAAMYVQQNNPDIQINTFKSDMSRDFFKLNGQENLNDVKLNIYVSDSQEMLRQTEMIRHLFSNNNNTSATALDLVTISTSNSPAEMKAQLAKSQDQLQAQQQQEYSLKQQELQMQQDKDARDEAWEREKFYAEIESKEKIAYMRDFDRGQNGAGQDLDKDGIPDVLEYDKLNQKASNDKNNMDIQREKNRLSDKKLKVTTDLANKKLQLDREKMKSNEKIEQDKLQVARTMKGKTTKK